MSDDPKSDGKIIWACIALVIFVGLVFFLPGIRNFGSRTKPQTIDLERSANTDPALRPSQSRASMLQFDSEHLMIFHVADDSTSTGVGGASLQIRLAGEKPLVAVSRSDFVTDRSGNCSVSLSAHPSSVTVRASGYVSRTLSFRSAEDFSAEYTVRLDRGITIGGFVRNLDGKPIPDVDLALP